MEEQKNRFRVSVRELVAFTFPPEDILPAAGLSDLQAGGTAHRARQAEQTGVTEKSISRVFALQGGEVELFGRMDAYTPGEVPQIEEMKLGSGKEEAPRPEHMAQVMLYGAMVALEMDVPRLLLSVTYISTGGEVLRRFEKTASREELVQAAEKWLGAYLPLLLREKAHRESRNRSIAELGFPYAQYRKGQRELAVQVYTSILRKKRLYASLPTGTGKSAAVLFPALKAMGQGETEKILYLTCRGTARQSPLEALDRMLKNGLDARITVLTAKEKLCPRDGHCHPDYCQRAKGHFLRQEKAIEQLLDKRGEIWTDEKIVAAADDNNICPFELALSLLELADVMLLDMNYVFDPFAQIKRLMQAKRHITMLADEAHHVRQRVQESLSGALDSGELAALRAAMGKRLGRKHRCYQAMTEIIKLLRALPVAMEEGETENEAQLGQLPSGLKEAAQRLLEETSALLQGMQGGAEAISLLRLLLPFLHAAEHISGDYAILQQSHGKERGVEIFCLHPAGWIESCTKGLRGAVFFSATLSPLEAMKDLLGGGEGDACFALPSPFPAENLKIIRRRVDTRYQHRDRSLHEVAQQIAEMANVHPGKYIAFFPSYAYLQKVLGELETMETPPLWVQKRSMDEEERNAFFEAFSAESGARLGLCVMGGLYSEGIDLPGDRLIGVIIVGVGLPTPDGRLRAMQRYYAEKFGDGFQYACRIPAMQKVLQAGGRIIRSETDKGLLLLLDHRYFEGGYTALLPEHWQFYAGEIQTAAKELWG